MSHFDDCETRKKVHLSAQGGSADPKQVSVRVTHLTRITVGMMWELPHAPMHDAAPVHPNSGSFPESVSVVLSAAGLLR